MRKLLALICACILIPLQASATAFGAATVWDVQTTGADTNGGGFDSGVGSPGTDESMGAGTAITITTASTTTGTGSPAFSATTHGPGNFVHIASGTGCTVGWYEILSQSAGTATFNVAIADAGGRTCVGVIGGSLLTLPQSTTNCVSGNLVYPKSGTYVLTATLDVKACNGLIGYQTTHGDLDALAWTNWTSASANFPLITTATNSTNLINFSQNKGYRLQNLSLSNTASVRAEGTYANTHTPGIVFQSVIMDGFTQAVDCLNGTNYDCRTMFANVEIKNSSTGAIGSNVYPTSVYASWIHNNASGGSTYCVIGQVGTQLSISRSLITNNTGSNPAICGSSDALISVEDSVIANNSNTGISFAATGTGVLANSIVYNNGTYGVVCGSGATSSFTLSNNAYGANGTAATNTCTSIYSQAAITLTADPFTNDASQDYSLNNTAGGGLLLRGLGIPAIFPGGLTTGKPDVGPVQTAGSSSTAGGPYGYVR